MAIEERSVEDRVFGVVREVLGIDDLFVIAPEHLLSEDLGAESIHMPDLFMELEEEFDIDIPEFDFEGSLQVSDLLDLVNYELDRKNQGAA